MKTKSPSRSRVVRNAAAGLLCTAALGFSLAACGDDSGSASAKPVTVKLEDFKFRDLPKSVKAGTQFSVQNISKSELHEFVAIRIPDNEKRSVGDLVKLPEEEQGKIFGDALPATVLLAPPGGDQITAVGDGKITEPGRYAIVCFIPTGVDPKAYLEAAEKSGDGPPQVDGGPPHALNGMFAELEVKPA
jgi:hypothetical protein